MNKQTFVIGQIVGIATDTTLRTGKVQRVTPAGQVVLTDGTRFNNEGTRINGTAEQRLERIVRVTDELLAQYETLDPLFAAKSRRERIDRLLARVDWARVPPPIANRVWEELRAAELVAPNAAGGGAWGALVGDKLILDVVRNLARSVFADRPDLTDLFAPIAARRAALLTALRAAVVAHRFAGGPLARLPEDEMTLIYVVDRVLGVVS